MHWNVVLTIFHTQQICYHAWKTVIIIFGSIIVLQLQGDWSHSIFLLFRAFSLLLKNKDTDTNINIFCSFPHMVTYMLWVENCWNYIFMSCCFPIAGRLSSNVWKLHITRILNVTIFCQAQMARIQFAMKMRIFPGMYMRMT